MTCTDQERKNLSVAACCAMAIEIFLLTAFGWQGHWLSHPPSPSNIKFIDAQIFEIPPEAQLTESQVHAKPEATISKVPNKGREVKPNENAVQEENQTQSGRQLAPTHGPVTVFSPSPKIPSFLQDREIHASVVIDFFVSAQGVSEPRLVGSSGNEELDAIAIEAAKRWRFRAAEKDHQPIDAKVRLRILFDVQ